MKKLKVKCKEIKTMYVPETIDECMNLYCNECGINQISDTRSHCEYRRFLYLIREDKKMIELHMTKNLKEQWIDLRSNIQIEKLLKNGWIITSDRWRYKDGN